MIRTNAVMTATVQAPATDAQATQTDWRSGLPVLSGAGVTLRELRSEDAEPLHALLTTEEVRRFISPPPSTVEGFGRFIDWTQRERAAGRYVCFAVVPAGCDTAVGIFQIRQLGTTFDVAEWGFALAQPLWGTGVFAAAAAAVVTFAIDVLDVSRLEARSAVENGRGNGALQKIGAVREAVLRQSFRKDGQCFDQVLWSINAAEWRFVRGSIAVRVH